MPRPREFDEMAALEAAIDCFWQHGYQATSVRDLATSMGISGPSLYNAFGDKHDLFARALEHYLDCTTRARIRRLEETLPPKRAIRQFFEEIVARSVGDRKRRGCFLVNSALEIAPHDATLGAIITARLGEIEAFFHRSIRAAQREGTVPRKVRPKDHARLLLGVLLGIRVLARAKPDKALLEGAARYALALLD
jgi:TetR/AcrR family transcriptional repressor of nem operon